MHNDRAGIPRDAGPVVINASPLASCQRSTTTFTCAVSPRVEIARISCVPGVNVHRSRAYDFPSIDQVTRSAPVPVARSATLAYRASTPTGIA